LWRNQPDVTHFLSSQILSGTVITQDDEMVYDVFELTPLKDASENSPEELYSMVSLHVENSNDTVVL
jgi:hypothetical protein